MRIDVYYDISCDYCARSASTDWGQGAFSTRDKVKTWAKKALWKTKGGNNICHVCQIAEKTKEKLRKYYDIQVVESVVLDHYIETNSWIIRCGLVECDIVRDVIKGIDFKSSSIKLFQ